MIGYVAWAALIACCAIAYALLADGDAAHRVLSASLASLWGFRLGAYLLFTRVLGQEEDGRYRALRARWGERANPANRGRTARVGLWSWSRHPNYFFEWVTWCGNAIVASTAPWGWLAWAVPAGLLYFLFRVTGIPPTEAQALRSRSDYAEYQRTTSVLVPLPPRRVSSP